jgi:hypothetical protein
MVFFVLCGVIYGIYDVKRMDQELKALSRIEYLKPFIIKKRNVRLYRDGRTRIVNDSFAIGLGLASFDNIFVLSENWGKVDSLIKKANSDTLKCVLDNGNVIYLEVDNPSNDERWQW